MFDWILFVLVLNPLTPLQTPTMTTTATVSATPGTVNQVISGSTRSTAAGNVNAAVGVIQTNPNPYNYKYETDNSEGRLPTQLVDKNNLSNNSSSVCNDDPEVAALKIQKWWKNNGARSSLDDDEGAALDDKRVVEDVKHSIRHKRAEEHIR